MATYVAVPAQPARIWRLVAPGSEAHGHEELAVELPAGDDHAGWNDDADAIELGGIVSSGAARVLQ